MNYSLIDLTEFDSTSGSLLELQGGGSLFDVRRVFHLYSRHGDDISECFANRCAEYLLVLLSGSCEVKISNSKENATVLLDNPTRALYIDKLLWIDLHDFADHTVLLILSSRVYDGADYLRDYAAFSKEVGNG